MRILKVLPLMVICIASCAHRPAVVAGPGTRVTPIESQLQFRESIPFEVGAVEFSNGDAISITEVRGSEPALSIGGVYLVKGHYRLTSRDKATILLSVTATQSSGMSAVDDSSRLEVARGEGDFELVKRISDVGYPHVTFYAADGRPIGGVYFGKGESLLKVKSWSYLP